jgi:hypothetical protein
MGRMPRRDGMTDGLAGTLFPTRVALRPPPETEIAELLEAPDVEAWAIEHEVTGDGHECEDLLLRYGDETKPAVYCPRCQLLVGAREWHTALVSGTAPEPTHRETAALVFRANIATATLLALMTWLAWLGFTTPGVALLLAAGALALWARVGREH